MRLMIRGVDLMYIPLLADNFSMKLDKINEENSDVITKNATRIVFTTKNIKHSFIKACTKLN